MKNFNPAIFALAFVLFFLLTAVSFYGAFGYDEGTHDSTTTMLNNLFMVMRFPTHTLLWKFMVINDRVFEIAFPLGLLTNVSLYAFLTERIVYYLTRWKDQK